ncbi:hypothetical protein SODALDRAFT_223537 [Sodiomyces alkalinus F11]|uniref:NACHT domain-containing protein n=1 Tax=Sodiomyces alkalinus (strain CBS 110278 / VKM F-3762 / F11) TaxID=1314773 RepID=A0A3N2PQA3_SODAK|nr:hypothetical protein SODALDRAFT_223537 [Sodiomyces alkalinus F11]ROT36610.1 hypothetical protein SODALDRAFT_223537 [Sodiomyces alkalinus F11]
MSDPLSVAGSIVGVVSLGITASQGLINYYEAFRGQQSAIDHTTRKLAHLRDFLDDLRRQLDARNSQHEDDDLLSSVRSSVEDCAAAIYGLKDELNKFDKTFRPGTMAGLLAAGRRVAYPFRERTLQRLNEDVDDVISCLSFAVQVLQQSDIGNIQRGIADIQVSIDDNRALLDLVRGSQVSSEIRAWLKAPDASINFNEILKRKHPGTGSWFTEGPDFTTWLTKPNSFLWLAGFAGCGKSVLASTTIHSVFQHRRGHPRIGVAFFFFTFNDESKQDASAMLRALVLQLSSQLGHGHTHLSGLYDAYRHATPPESALLECLHDVIRDFNDVYIVLDALDESPRQKHRGTLLDILADLRKDEPGLHLLVSSRDEVDIREGLKALPEETIKLKNEFIDRDIASFISQYLQQRLQRWAEFHDKIETALTTGAKGVFRWVECQFKILADCPESEDLLEKQLESLPPTLDETYRRMLDNIPLASKPYARQMLAVLCCASRPLKVDELTDAIAVQLDDPPTYNTKRKLKNAEAIHRVCPGLVEIDKDRYYGDTVRLAHFSIREFLELDPGSERIDAGFYRVVPQDAHTDVASICLAVLRELVPLEPATLALQFYAARYWPEHYRSGRADRLEAQILQLFTHHSLFVNLSTLLRFPSGYRFCYSEPPSRWRHCLLDRWCQSVPGGVGRRTGGLQREDSSAG